MNDQSTELTTAYLSHRPAIRRFLVARLGSESEADDVLQELFLKISRFESVDAIREPLSYLFRVAMNLAHDHRRQRRRASIRETDWSDGQHTMAGSEAITDIPSAESAYAAKQRVAAVRRALDELSPQCRRVFTLHKLEGLSHQQVAEKLGISRSTVEKHMHTALKHLIERLGSD